MLAVGTTAPDFTLKDQSGNEVSLSGYRGTSPVVLVFYPFTFTGVCQGELKAASLVRHRPRARGERLCRSDDKRCCC